MNKLGQHVNAWTSSARGTVRAAPPKVLKVLSSSIDRSEIDRWRRARPDGILVYRHYFPNESFDDVAGRCNALMHAAAQIKEYKLDYVETPWNEAGYSGDDLRRHNQASVEATRILQGYGYKVAVGNFSVGWLHIDEHGNSDWPLFYDALSAADAISIHEYSAPTMQHNQSWHCLRYRRMWELLPLDCRKPVLITETGIDWGVLAYELTGWRGGNGAPATPINEYVNQLRWYAEEMAKDSYVLGATIFACGQFGDWASFDVAAVGEIESLLRETIGEAVQPPVEGNVSPDEFIRWAADKFKRAGVAFNAEAGLVKFWLDEARAGRYLGSPESGEFPSENGRYVLQEFANAIIHYDRQTGRIARGIPFV